VRADPGSFRWCQALSRLHSFATSKKATINNNLINNNKKNNNILKSNTTIIYKSVKRIATTAATINKLKLFTLYVTTILLLCFITYSSANSNLGENFILF